MLTTVDKVLSVPGMNNAAAVPVDFLNMLIGAADTSIKSYCKQDLEMRSLVEYKDGDFNLDIILKQWPLWGARTQVAAGSDGAVLPQATINVVSTSGFSPGTFSNPSASAPTLSIQTGINSWTTITYTGTTATSFTGCAGGTGTLASTTNRNSVATPSVWHDPNGYYGATQGGFGDGTLLAYGSTYAPVFDRERKSKRGLIRRIAGSSGDLGGGSGVGLGWFGYGVETLGRGKLAGSRPPVWPRGQGNLKIAYTAGYYPLPDDLIYAATMLVVQMVRILPTGANLSNESLGSYGYGVLMSPDPEMGDLRRVLASYREIAW